MDLFPIIDAHSHLWLRQDTQWDGKPIRTLRNGRSLFLGEEVQMVPPFIIDGRNTAEVFLSNMDYAQVSAAVVVQEFIDGLQNDYLAEVMEKYADRFFVFGMADYLKDGFLEQAQSLLDQGFRGQEVITQCPRLKIAIGHLGMANPPQTPCWENDSWRRQILLARHENVYIETGGITWLYNAEFYPYPSAVRAICEAAALVGMDKLMWGSDYPRTITAITYRMSYDFLLKSDALSEQEKRLLLGQNAQRFYGFEHLEPLPYINNMSE